MLIAVSSADRLDLWQAIVLGFVQGVTEFLPISSSAHLKVVPVALGWGDPGVAFTAVIQLGSIVAVLAYFRQDLAYVVRGLISALRRKDFRSEPAQMGLGILLGTIPIVIGGLLIKRFIPDYDNSPLRSLAAIAIVSMVMGLLLGITERLSQHQRDLSQLRLADGLWMGLAQTLALIPGVSRSGSTLTAGLFRGLKRDAAARFSFLLGIPAITLAGLVELKDSLEQGLNDASLGALVVGTLSALVFSWLAIAWLLRFLRTHNTWGFVIYRIIFGGLILTAIATGSLQNI